MERGFWKNNRVDSSAKGPEEEGDRGRHIPFEAQVGRAPETQQATPGGAWETCLLIQLQHQIRQGQHFIKVLVKM